MFDLVKEVAAMLDRELGFLQISSLVPPTSSWNVPTSRVQAFKTLVNTLQVRGEKCTATVLSSDTLKKKKINKIKLII